MASNESYYTSGVSSRPVSQSFTSPSAAATPPPPPPKPISQIQAPSRTVTPQSPSGPPLPPTPQSYPPADSPRPQPPLPPSTHGTPAPPTALQYQHQPTPTPSIRPPSLQDFWLPESLPSKQTSDLTSVLSNAPLLSALSSTHPSHASSLSPLTAALSTNVSAASQVSALADQVAALRAQTSHLILTHQTLQTQWRRIQSAMDDALSPWGPRAMYQRLVSSIAEQEAVLRALQESFMDGGDGGSLDGDYRPASSAGDDGRGGGGNGGGNRGKATEKEVNEWIRRIREGTTVLEKRREMRARWDEGRVGGWR